MMTIRLLMLLLTGTQVVNQESGVLRVRVQLNIIITATDNVIIICQIKYTEPMATSTLLDLHYSGSYAA
jgi:hypothetical protein